MGFLDSLFGTGGSASQEQARTTAQTNYPDWYNRLQQANLLRAAEAAFEEYQPYGGPRMALAGPEQQAARAGFGGLAGIAAPSFAEAMRQSRLGATQLAGADITPYMSPFQQAVTDVALREARRQGDIQRRGLESQATKVGAFGGSRAALEQMEAERNIQRGLADIQATGSQAAYESALAQLSADRAAAAAAAPQMAALGTGLQGALTSGLKEAELAGERERAERQGALDIAYQDYLTQRAYPLAQASGLQSLLGGATVPGTTLSTTFGQPPSVAGQIGGLGLSTLGLLGMFLADGGEVRYKNGSPGGVWTYDTVLNNFGRDMADLWQQDPNTFAALQGLTFKELEQTMEQTDPATLYTQYPINSAGIEDRPYIMLQEQEARRQREADRIAALGRSLEQRFPPAPEVTPEVTPELTATEPDQQEDLVSEESKGLDIPYNDLLTAGLAMMSAASQPGASVVGSLGAGGLAALQAKKEEELARRKLDLTERELDIMEGRYRQEYLDDITEAERKQLEDSLKYYNDMINNTQEKIDDYRSYGTDEEVINSLIEERDAYIVNVETLAELLGYDNIPAIPSDVLATGQQTQ